MSSNAVINIVIIAVVSLFAGVIGFVPDDQPQVVTAGTGVGSTDELLIEDGAGEAAGPAAGGGGGGGGGTVGGSSGSAGTESSVTGGGSQQGGGGGGGDAGASGPVACEPGQNGGETDAGVSSNRIGLASTIVTSGPGSTFLGQSRFGMQALVVKVNSAGGICGRQLDLKLVNDNWEAQRGHGFIRNFINDPGIFALPVVPSSEGLDAASRDIEGAGIPVVGTDGMLIGQYQNPWIWPVATATVSQMRIAAKYAYDEGDARKFAIVYDEFYRFGVEGEKAFRDYVNKKLSGAEVVHTEGVLPDQPGYGTQIDSLNEGCSGGCDAVMYLLDPGTANTWVQGDNDFDTRSDFRLGAQPLFTDNFGQQCGQRCNGMLVFTGYVPALEGNADLPGVKRYVQEVRAVQPNADTSNQFLQGAYLGMSVFVEALQEVGPNLTRARLREVMNSMTYKSDLSSDLQWSESRRKANQKAQVWRISASPSFDGFSYTRSGFLQDPDPGAE